MIIVSQNILEVIHADFANAGEKSTAVKKCC